MQTLKEYQFKPAGKWNFIPEQVYLELQKYYEADMLRIIGQAT